jgi:endonuclease/exonuclease/phosphatase family metal-dependent hydrolase
MKFKLLFALCVVMVTGHARAAPHSPSELKLATWNLEWFMQPETVRALGPACTPRDAPRDGARRALPCDVAHELARSNEDIVAMRNYARDLDADVVALQEVDGADAAHLIFPDYDFCFSGRIAVQNNGFAIRRGLPFACGNDVTDLSLDDDVRRGVELELFPGTPRSLHLLSVHLKSGCARDPLDSVKASCAELKRQAPYLERWIETQATGHKPFAVLGDFNRDLQHEPAGATLWAEIDAAEAPGADLVNTADGQKFQNCMPSQTFSGFIDYIVLGHEMARGLVPGSFGRELYRPRDAARRKLSDHCPVFIRLRVADAARPAS